MAKTNTLLALDVGTRRIGVAVAGNGVSIARPLGIINVDGTEVGEVQRLFDEHQADKIIVGFPRNQSGESTAQTKIVQAFGDTLEKAGLPISYQDESLTSVHAEEHLKRTKRPYTKGDIDAVAAALILTDYLEAR